MDDIVVYSKDQNEHYQQLNTVLQTLAKHGLVINYDKCNFVSSCIEFLGFKVEKNLIKPSTKKWIFLKMLVP